MFNRRNRIPNARAVKKLFSKGRRIIKPTIFFYSLDNYSRLPRFAVVCGLKVSKKATVRNRLKRVARSIIETDLAKIPSGKDYLIVLRPAALNEEVLRKDVEEFFRIGLSH